MLRDYLAARRLEQDNVESSGKGAEFAVGSVQAGFLTPAFGQIRASAHWLQRGRIATQTRRPCSIRRWLRSTQCFRGTSTIKSRSIAAGSRLLVSPRRYARRLTWVSTTNPEAIP